ncbi:vancomycin resistance protein YoaR [Paenibacillus endophyticus]|uniref:Vancomycin resistance protein YoaR n=1 Tax=Paenibacillus endophyticus TaxID=1294268 RepID=A0A7W5GBT0_9BACL|nr:VanW family protein [Paenibacillus endophyticus]MBB3154659.1 vancomycin resistance protein YoaR [Paenibacillus endophyticus]
MIRIVKRIHIGIIVLASLLLAAAVCWGFVWNYALQKTVPKQVDAGGIQIGGLTLQEALNKLDQYEKSLLQRTITIQSSAAVASDSKQWTVSELGYKAAFTGAREALAKLEEGDIWERAVYRYQFQKSYALIQSWNADVFDAAVRKQWSWVEKNETKNATRTITDDDHVVYEPHVDAYRLDTAELTARVDQWVMLPKEKIGLPVEMAFTDTLPITTIHPELTLEKLKDEGIERKIISFSTDFKTSAEGRAHNVTVTAEALDGWELAPGEIFDYNSLIEHAEELYEYREAPVILNGKLVPGIGGGICQVSSTLYNAALRAGLEIVERRNHSLPVAYLPIGQDATYAGGAINFRFKNTTGKHLIIRTQVEDRKLTIKLFGTMDPNESYDIESVTLKTIAPSVQERSNASLSPGQKAVVEEGKLGYVVETFRTLKKNGKLVSRDRISHDTYKAQPALIEVGPHKGGNNPAATPTPAPSVNEPLLEDGI